MTGARSGPGALRAATYLTSVARLPVGQQLGDRLWRVVVPLPADGLLDEPPVVLADRAPMVGQVAGDRDSQRDGWVVALGVDVELGFGEDLIELVDGAHRLVVVLE